MRTSRLDARSRGTTNRSGSHSCANSGDTMLHMVIRQQWKALAGILLVGLAVLLVAVRSATAQGNGAPKQRYKADVVASTVARESRAAALEALLNKRAEEGYEIFD